MNSPETAALVGSSGSPDEWIAGLPHTELRIAWLVAATLGYGNRVTLTQAEIGRRLRIKRPNVSTAVRELCDRGVLAPLESQPGARRRYMFNPRISYAGPGEQLAEVMGRWRRRYAAHTLSMPPARRAQYRR